MGNYISTPSIALNQRTGAKIVLYRLRDGQICAVKGDRKSIGYRRAKEDLQFTAHEIMAQEGDRFYLATDGYTDQNGEKNEYPFESGLKRTYIEFFLTK